MYLKYKSGKEPASCRLVNKGNMNIVYANLVNLDIYRQRLQNLNGSTEVILPTSINCVLIGYNAVNDDLAYLGSDLTQDKHFTLDIEKSLINSDGSYEMTYDFTGHVHVEPSEEEPEEDEYDNGWVGINGSIKVRFTGLFTDTPSATIVSNTPCYEINLIPNDSAGINIGDLKIYTPVSIPSSDIEKTEYT